MVDTYVHTKAALRTLELMLGDGEAVNVVAQLREDSLAAGSDAAGSAGDVSAVDWNEARVGRGLFFHLQVHRVWGTR